MKMLKTILLYFRLVYSKFSDYLTITVITEPNGAFSSLLTEPHKSPWTWARKEKMESRNASGNA